MAHPYESGSDPISKWILIVGQSAKYSRRERFPGDGRMYPRSTIDKCVMAKAARRKTRNVVFAELIIKYRLETSLPQCTS
jgi:hypothetical protein